MNCRDWEGALATLAEGGAAPEAESHLETCPSCQKRLKELRTLIESARFPFTSPPSELVARAQGVFKPRLKAIARLLGSSLATTGARSMNADLITVRLAAEDIHIPLEFSRTAKEWQVLGRAPSPDWAVLRGEAEITSDSAGRFGFSVPRLAESGFTLVSREIEIEVPPASELLNLDT